MRQFLRSTTALWIACGLAGCAFDGEEPVSREEQVAINTATQVRLVHASATSNPFDIYVGVGTTPIFAGLAYGAVTDYTPVSAGTVDLAFRPAGAAPTTNPVFSTQLTIGEGETVTAVAAGLLGSAAAANRFRVQAFVEGFAPVARGRLRARFVQASHGFAAAGFDVRDDASLEVADLPAFAASDAAGLSVASSRRGLQLAVWTGTPSSRRTAFTLPAELTASGQELFLVLAGLPTFRPRETRGVALLAIGRDAAVLIKQNPTYYLLPAIPDAAQLDSFLFGGDVGLVQLTNDAAFGALTPVQLPPSEEGYDLVLTSAGEVARASTGPLAAGERYLGVASGFLQGSQGTTRPCVAVASFRDGFVTQVTASGAFRGIAASPGAPLLDIGRFPPGAGTPFAPVAGLGGLAFLTASAEAGVVVDSAPLNPGVRPTGTESALRFDFAALANVERAFGVAAGAWAPRAAETGPSFIAIQTPASGAWTAQVLAPL